MIAPIVSKTALSEQKQDSLNTSVSVVAPDMQQLHSLPFSNTFFTLLPTKGGVAGDVSQRDARTIITFGTMYMLRPDTQLDRLRSRPPASKPVDLLHNHENQLARFKTDRQLTYTHV